MLFSLLLNQPFCFWRNHNENAAASFFCVIPANAPYIVYIKIWVEKFHLLIYVNYKTYVKAMLYKFFS